MNISVINSCSNVLKIPNNIKSNYKYKNLGLSKDTVSFSGLYYNPTAENKNVKEATALGKDILSKLNKGATKADITKLIKEQNPDIEILPIEELKNIAVDPQNYGAFFQYHFGDKYEVESPKLYLDLKENNSKLSNLFFAMETAHEYTHLKQLKNGDNQNFFNKISPDDGVYGGMISALGGFLFSEFDNKMQAEYTIGVFDIQDKLSVMQTGKIIPRENNVSKKQMLAGKNQSEAEFKKIINGVFAQNFQNLIKTLIKNPQYSEPKLYNKLTKTIKKKEDIEKLYSDLKAYCKYNADLENEAYTTESQVAKYSLNTKKMLNIDIFPIYYNMLSEALT